MNVLQGCRAIQYLLTKQTWAPDGTEFVFGSAVVTAGAVEGAAQVLRMPICLINVGDAETDLQAPEFEKTNLEIRLVVAHSGDATGQSALLGGNPTGTGTQGQGSSQGKGLLQVEEQLLAVLAYIDQNSGVRIHVASKSAAVASFDPDVGYIAHRDYVVALRSSISRSYDAPLSFKATAPGGGAVSLTWKNPPLRFDFDSTSHDNNPSIALGAALVLRRIAGATPPVFGAAPTGVVVQTWTNFAALPTSFGDTPGAGTWSYALAAAFDETMSNTQERFSDVPATISGLVVT